MAGFALPDARIGRRGIRTARRQASCTLCDAKDAAGGNGYRAGLGDAERRSSDEACAQFAAYTERRGNSQRRQSGLVTEKAERQLEVIPDLFHLDKEVSISIGIPFRPTKCAYCTFPAYDILGNNGSVSAFLEGLHHEIRETGKWLRKTGLGITRLLGRRHADKHRSA